MSGRRKDERDTREVSVEWLPSLKHGGTICHSCVQHLPPFPRLFAGNRRFVAPVETSRGPLAVSHHCLAPNIKYSRRVFVDESAPEESVYTYMYALRCRLLIN